MSAISLSQNFTLFAQLPEEKVLPRLELLFNRIEKSPSLLSKEIYAELIPVLLIHGNPTSGYTEGNSKFGIMARSRPEFEPGEAGAERAQLEQVERVSRASKSVARRRSQKPNFEFTSVYIKTAKKLMLLARKQLGGLDKEKIEPSEDLNIKSGSASVSVHILLTQIPSKLIVEKQVTLPEGFSTEVLNVYKEYLYKGSIDCKDLDLLKKVVECSRALKDPVFKKLCKNHYFGLKNWDRNLITEDDLKFLRKRDAHKLFKEFFINENHFYNFTILEYLLLNKSPAISWMKNISIKVKIENVEQLDKFFSHMCVSSDLRLPNVTIDLSKIGDIVLLKFLKDCGKLFENTASDHFFMIETTLDYFMENDPFILTALARRKLTMGHVERGRQLLNKAHSRDPENTFTRKVFAEFHVMLNTNFQKAEKERPLFSRQPYISKGRQPCKGTPALLFSSFLE